MTFSPNPRLAQDAEVITQVLLGVNPGDLITYDELRSKTGLALKGGDSALQKALRALETRGVHFECRRRVGYERLDDSGIVRSAERGRLNMNRISRRYIKKLEDVNDFEALTPYQKRMHNTYMISFKVSNRASSRRGIKQIENAVTTTRITNAQLREGVMKLFGKSS